MLVTQNNNKTLFTSNCAWAKAVTFVDTKPITKYFWIYRSKKTVKQDIHHSNRMKTAKMEGIFFFKQISFKMTVMFSSIREKWYYHFLIKEAWFVHSAAPKSTIMHWSGSSFQLWLVIGIPEQRNTLVFPECFKTWNLITILSTVSKADATHK